jgi:hypothetical protein
MILTGFYLSQSVDRHLSMFFLRRDCVDSISAMRLRGMFSRGRWGSAGGCVCLERQEDNKHDSDW